MSFITTTITDACASADFFNALCETGSDAIEGLEHHSETETPEARKKVEAVTERLIVKTPYGHVAHMQHCANPHTNKRISLSISSLLSTMVQNLSQVFQSINTYPTFTNVVNSPAFTLGFLIFGAVTSILSFAIATYNTYKAVVLNKTLNAFAEAKARLDTTVDTYNTHPAKREIYEISEKLLTLERNKAIRNIVMSIISITVFVTTNVLSMGIPLLVIIGCAILFAIVKICVDIHATGEMKKHCREFEREMSFGIRFADFEDQAIAKEYQSLVTFLIPLIQMETGFCFGHEVMRQLPDPGLPSNVA